MRFRVYIRPKSAVSIRVETALIGEISGTAFLLSIYFCGRLGSHCNESSG